MIDQEEFDVSFLPEKDIADFKTGYVQQAIPAAAIGDLGQPLTLGKTAPFRSLETRINREIRSLHGKAMLPHHFQQAFPFPGKLFPAA